MDTTPDEIEDVLYKLRKVLERWYSNDTLGDIVIKRGGNEYQLFEHRQHKIGTVKRESKRAGYVERVGQP